MKKWKYMTAFAGCLLFGSLLATGCGASGSSEEKKDASEITATVQEQAASAVTESEEMSSEEEVTREAPKTEETSSEDESAFIRLMPDVTLPMLNADYWSDLRADADEVIMSGDEIAQFNQDLVTDDSEQAKFLRYSEESGKRSISADDLKKMLDESDFSDQTYYLDGSALGSSYWSEQYDKENYDAIKDDNELQYGFTVERTSMRLLPTDDVVSTEEEFTFYDELQMSSLPLNEPVIVLHESKDGEWFFVMSYSCSGWVDQDCIALSSSYEEWNEDRNPADFLIFTEDKVQLEYDPVDSDSSELTISMGTKLPLDLAENYEKSSEGREAYENYVVKIPVRAKDGSLTWEHAYVPVSKGVHYGYLNLTQRNLVEIAFNALGARYGWGGMYHARDCSLYIMDVYRCFGITLPRNTTGMTSMNCKTYDVSDSSDKEKKEILKDLPIGSILLIKGHVMLYLGNVDDNYYVISASASTVTDPDSPDKVTMVESVVVNDLDICRKSGGSWLANIATIKVVK